MNKENIAMIKNGTVNNTWVETVFEQKLAFCVHHGEIDYHKGFVENGPIEPPLGFLMDNTLSTQGSGTDCAKLC